MTPSHRLPVLRHLILLSLFAARATQAASFTYTGQLQEFGTPASGRYDLKLAVHADAMHGNTIVAPIEYSGVDVVDGRFRVDFDLPAGNEGAFVELSIRPAGTASWIPLPGRTEAITTPAAIGQCWSSTGDSGSDPAIHFLGTTDAQPLVLRTLNVQSLRIVPSTDVGSNRPNIIAGAAANAADSGVRGATISGGGTSPGDEGAGSDANRVTGNFGTVSGGHSNTVNTLATIGGGDFNTALGQSSAIGGGSENFAAGVTSSVGGGELNVAGGNSSTVGGGSQNSANGVWATVGGGFDNTANGNQGSIVGGSQNMASGASSAVVGGRLNTASGDLGTVGGGERNCAGGEHSWAGGWDAKVRVANNLGSGQVGEGCSGVANSGDDDGDNGTFLWSDSLGLPFVSSGPNQFLVRADGGLFVNGNNRVLSGDDVIFRARPSTGDADIDLRLQTRAGKSLLMFVSESTGGLTLNLTDVAAGANRLTVNGGSGGGATLTNGGTWANASSRTFKEGFHTIDPTQILHRLLDLPITTWSYKGSGEGQHLGPVAEDFKAAFGLAGDGKSIATVDADGVALAAIQGLNAKLEEQNAALLARIAALEAALAERAGD